MFKNLYAYYDGRIKQTEKGLIEKLAGRPLYFYETRHNDDGDWVTPVTIEKRVVVNFCNTLIYTEPLDFGGSNFILIDEGEWDFDFPQIDISGDIVTLPEGRGAPYG